MLVACCLLGWVAYERGQAAEQRAAYELIVAKGGSTNFGAESSRSISVTLNRTPAAGFGRPKLLRGRLRSLQRPHLVPWVCDVLPSMHSRKAYLDDLRLFLLHMKELQVHPFQVTGDHVRIYKEALARAGKRPGTIARALSVIRGTYEQFGKKGFLPWDVVGDIRAVSSPRVEKNTTPALSEAEAKRLLHAPNPNTLKGIRDHALIFTYFITACRCSALINARVGDIEKPDHRFYLVVREKGGKTQRKALLEADGLHDTDQPHHEPAAVGAGDPGAALVPAAGRTGARSNLPEGPAENGEAVQLEEAAAIKRQLSVA